MQLTVTFTDSGFPDFSFTATEKSLVKDATEAAAEEWGTDGGFLELSFAGEFLASASRLVEQCGVVADSVLDASPVRWIGKDLLMRAVENEKVAKILFLLIERSGHSLRTLRLDTPTFANDGGLLAFGADYTPLVIEGGIPSISFGNPDDSVVSVAADFLRGLTISSVDLMGLQHVTLLGDRFLSASSLTTVDLSALTMVETVGDGFLCDCLSLTSIDLSGLLHVSTIGHEFLARCSSLTSIHHRFQRLRSIGDKFLLLCESLTAIDLSTFPHLEHVGDSFLYQCSSLESVDLSPFVNVTCIGNSFLYRCSSLKEISNMSALSNVTSFGMNFLAKCSSLKSVDLSFLDDVPDAAFSDPWATLLDGCSSLSLVSRISVFMRVADPKGKFPLIIILWLFLLTPMWDYAELTSGFKVWYLSRECFMFVNESNTFVLWLLWGCFVEVFLPFWAVEEPASVLVYFLFVGLVAFGVPIADCSSWAKVYKLSARGFRLRVCVLVILFHFPYYLPLEFIAEYNGCLYLYVLLYVVLFVVFAIEWLTK